MACASTPRCGRRPATRSPGSSNRCSGQTLVVDRSAGLGEPREFDWAGLLPLQAWDADNGRIVFTDNRLGLHVIDLESGRVREIARNTRQGGFDVALSPDGRWLAYTLRQPNYFRDLVYHDFGDNRSVRCQTAWPMSPRRCSAATASSCTLPPRPTPGPIQFSLDMSSQERPYRAGLYALVLAADGDSPLKPRAPATRKMTERQ
jgi:tricorn protease